MSLRIFTSFTHDNKSIEGFFIVISGGGNLYHLMVDNFYRGQLTFSEHFGWGFSSNTWHLEHLSEYFAERVAVALESVV